MAEPIQLDPNIPKQDPISLDTGNLGDIGTSPQVAAVRASKASLGLGSITGMSQPEIQDLILSGKERGFRETAAAQLDRYNITKRTDAVRQGLIQGVHPDKLNQIAVDYNRTDPSTVIEHSFAKYFVNPLIDRTDPFMATTTMKSAHEEIPTQVETLHDMSSRLAAKDQYYKTVKEGIDDTYKKQSWLGWGADQVKNAFQPYMEFKMRGLTDQASSWAEGLLGSTLKAEADDINRLPTVEQVKARLDPIMEKLKNDNPTLAQHFMNYILHSADANPEIDNFWTATLAAGALGGVGKAAAKRIELFTHASKTAKDLSEGARNIGHVATDDPEIARWENEGGAVSPEVSRATASGDLETAAVKRTAEDLQKDVLGTSNPTKRAIEDMPSVLKRQIEDNNMNPGNHGQELKNAINEGLLARHSDQADLMKQRLTKSWDRIPDITENEALAKQVLEEERAKFPRIARNILNVQGFFPERISGHWTYDLIIGDPEGENFKSYGQAREWARENNEPIREEVLEPFRTILGSRLFVAKRRKIMTAGSIIDQDGSGYFIRKNQPFDTTQPGLKAFYGQTETSKAPQSWIRKWTTWISSGEDTQSKDQRIMKLFATEGIPKFYEHIKDNLKEIKKLSKAQADDFEKVLEVAQKTPDINNKGIPGIYYRDIGDLDDAYLRVVGRLPEDNEVKAYFEYKGNGMADHYFRTAMLIKHKGNLGGQSHTILAEGADKKIVRAPPFEGRLSKEFPEGKHSILIVKRHIDHSSIEDTSKMSSKTKDELKDNMKTGKGQMYQVLDPDLHQLTGFAGVEDTHRIQYVYAYNVESQALDWNAQIPFRGAGHLDDEYNHHLSQAKVYWDNSTKSFNYVGDANLHPVDNSLSMIQKKEIESRYENVRKLIAAGDEDGARKLATDKETAIPIAYDKFRAKFETSKVEGKTLKPVLSKTEPIRLRPKDAALIDLDNSIRKRYSDKKGKSRLVDGTRSGNLMRTSMVQYTGERDAYEFHVATDEGSKQNPVFALNPGKHVDAVPMMNRALGRIIHSYNMDDYKTSSVDHWLFGAQVADPRDGKMYGAEHYLKVNSPNEILHSPFTFFNTPEFLPNTPIEVKSALLADRMKIRQFIGTPSVIDTALHSIEQKISDSVYGAFGPKAMKLAPLWQVSALSDAPRILRSIVMNTKMGFFSPRQFFLHFFTTMNAFLIAPGYARLGSFGATLHGMSYANASESFLKHLDGLAQKMGYRPGEWREIRDAMIQTNFHDISKSQLALVDNPMANNMIQNKFEKFLDAGLTPFTAGAKSMKTIAWFMAHKEWRDIHPTGRLTDVDIGHIMLRANDFAHNMGRASTSTVQKGLATFGMQFSTYNLRVAELLLGKRLSVPERARLFLGYATIFGVPTAGGIFGLSTFIRKNVNEGNVPGLQTYVPGYSTPSTLLMEGALSTLVSTISGNVYNWGESFGAKDLDFYEKSLTGDTNIWQAFGGALYSEVASGWANSDGFRHAIASMWRQDGEYKLTAESGLNFLREISAANYFYKAYMGVEYGKWMSRNNSYLEPTSPGNAIFMGIMGLSSQAESNMYIGSLDAKDTKAAVELAVREYGKEMQKFIQATHDQDPEQAKIYGRNAAWLLNAIPEQRKPQAVSEAYRDSQDLVNRTNFQRATSRDIPDDDKARRMEIYNKQQQMKGVQ